MFNVSTATNNTSKVPKYNLISFWKLVMEGPIEIKKKKLRWNVNFNFTATITENHIIQNRMIVTCM